MFEGEARFPNASPKSSVSRGLAIALSLIAVVSLMVGAVVFLTFGKEGRVPATICGDLLGERGGTTQEFEACVAEETAKTPFDASQGWWVIAGLSTVGAITSLLVSHPMNSRVRES